MVILNLKYIKHIESSVIGLNFQGLSQMKDFFYYSQNNKTINDIFVKHPTMNDIACKYDFLLNLIYHLNHYLDKAGKYISPVTMIIIKKY